MVGSSAAEPVDLRWERSPTATFRSSLWIVWPCKGSCRVALPSPSGRRPTTWPGSGRAPVRSAGTRAPP